MFCPSCGKEFADGFQICPYCNTYVEEPAVFPGTPVQQYGSYKNYAPARKQSFTVENVLKSVILFFKNYVNFEGRTTAFDYWVSTTIVSALLALIEWILMEISTTNFGWFIFLFLPFAFVIPMMSAGIRRLHDTGRPWTYLLVGLVPLVGPIILLVLYFQSSDDDNEWGPRL